MEILIMSAFTTDSPLCASAIKFLDVSICVTLFGSVKSQIFILARKILLIMI